jgi:hypothetical protein
MGPRWEILRQQRYGGTVVTLAVPAVEGSDLDVSALEGAAGESAEGQVSAEQGETIEVDESSPVQ